MSKDISPILEGWPHEPGKISVRKIRGQDGRLKIQLRVDLGVLQMEAEGRPDGAKPHGFDSLLEYYQKLLERHRRTTGTDEGFALDERQCELLRGESAQFYYRYLSEFVLEEYQPVARDTSRNLRCLDFCARYGRTEPDRLALEQYRPYVIMMNTRARAFLALQASRPRLARKIINLALRRLRDYYGRFGQDELYEHSSEVSALEAMRKDVEAEIPLDPLAKLRRQLAKAVREERYEEAARLRDVIARSTLKPAQPKGNHQRQS